MNTKAKLSLFILFFLSVFSLSGQSEATVFGVIRDEYNQPVDNVYITIEGSSKTALSTLDGLFEIKIPSNLQVKIRFQHISYQDTTISIKLKAGEKTKLEFTMFTMGNKLNPYKITANYDDGYTRVDPKLSFKLPSPTGGVESLLKTIGAGVFSSNELSSQYNVRGGNYDENLIYVNDVQIYRPFLIRSAQQEGMSFVNMDLTNSVKFSAGGFEAKYDDKMSSVLDVEYKKPVHYGGSFSISFLGGSAHVEGNVKDKFTFIVGARYKANTYLLKSLDTKGEYKPRFFDVQALLSWKLTEKLELSLLANFSQNQYLFVPKDRETDFGTLEDAKRLKIYFDGQELDKYENTLGALSLSYKHNDKNLLKFIVSSYYAKESETYDIQSQYWLNQLEADFGGDEVAQVVSLLGVGTSLEHARNYLTAIVSNIDFRGDHKFYRNTLSWGVKVQNEVIKDKIKEWNLIDSAGYTLPHIQPTPGEIIPLGDPSRLLNVNSYLVSENNLNTFRFTGFVQDTWKIDRDSAARFILNGGLRFHYWTFNKEFIVSPRLSFCYKPHWKRDWEFRLKTGMYYQPAFYREMRDENGVLNDKIKAQRSYQVVASADYNFFIWRRPFKFTAETYYKYMDRLIPYSVDNVKIIYSAQNNAKGYATGIDMKLSGEFIEGLESWISISLMKTMEDIHGDYYYNYYDSAGTVIKTGSAAVVDSAIVYPGYIPRPSDQLFSINLFFQDNVPFIPQFRVHLNFVFASGLPYGAPNSPRYMQTLRMPWYRRVDVGFSYMFLEAGRDRKKHKKKFFQQIKNAGVFFEVFNVLGINNVSSYYWVSDIDNNLYPVPNYLTTRLINLKFMVEF